MSDVRRKLRKNVSATERCDKYVVYIFSVHARCAEILGNAEEGGGEPKPQQCGIHTDLKRFPARNQHAATVRGGRERKARTKAVQSTKTIFRGRLGEMRPPPVESFRLNKPEAQPGYFATGTGDD